MGFKSYFVKKITDSFAECASSLRYNLEREHIRKSTEKHASFKINIPSESFEWFPKIRIRLRGSVNYEDCI